MKHRLSPLGVKGLFLGIAFTLTFWLPKPLAAQPDHVYGVKKEQVAKHLAAARQLLEGYRHPDSAQYHARRAHGIAQALNNTQAMAWARHHINEGHWAKHNFDSVLRHEPQVLAYFKSQAHVQGMVESYDLFGLVYWRTGNYPQAMAYLDSAHGLVMQQEWPALQAKVLNHQGILYLENSQNVEALEYFQASLKLEEQLNNPTGIARMQNNIGIIYQRLEEWSAALGFYERAYATRKAMGQKVGMANVLGNMAIVYQRWGKPLKAMALSQESLQLGKETRHLTGMASEYLLLGQLHKELKEYGLAKAYLDSCRQTWQAMGGHWREAEPLISLAQLAWEQQKPGPALAYARKSLALARQGGSAPEARLAHATLYEYYKTLGRPAEALRHFEEKQRLDDSLQQEANQETIKRLEMAYAFEKERQQLQAQQEQEQLVHATRLGQERKYRGVLWGVVALIAVLLAWLYRLYRTQGKAHRLLGQQQAEVARQNGALEQMNYMLKEKNEDITASMHYARRIQHAIIPNTQRLQKAFPHSMVLYRPRDIVSGDFYWMQQQDDTTVLAVADCTGHGVPGALMSMVGSSLLDHIVLGGHEQRPHMILNQLQVSLNGVLHQNNNTLADGMDIAVVAINHKARTLQFAGANMPLALIQNSAMQVLKGTPRPIGKDYQEQGAPPFAQHSLNLEEETTLYLFSDGYRDQFGGHRGRKFMRRRFYALLHQLHTMPMAEQQTLLTQTLDEWMGEEQQVDDILVLGLKIPAPAKGPLATPATQEQALPQQMVLAH